VANPNNPDGKSRLWEELLELANTLNGRRRLVVDEAFAIPPLS
jgi:histidinol-phosphate/aromatic aminotransferase/cobyric acid decarboxylase-like protein